MSDQSGGVKWVKAVMGDYQASASKTLQGSMDNALDAWQGHIGKAREFNRVEFPREPTISKTDKWCYWRVHLTDQSKVTIVIGDKGAGKTQVAVSHEKLPDKKAAER